MKIYFDTCALNRPLDDKSELRIALEAEAVLGILERCEVGAAAYVSSEVLVLENDRTPHPQRRAFIAAVLERASNVITVTDAVRGRAKILEQGGFKAFDALHIACAEAANVDYLCTCDDRLLKKANRRTDLAVKVVSPLELAQESSA
ncbi:MAG: PIN domain-containing protein [Planctomycetales bacterium]